MKVLENSTKKEITGEIKVVLTPMELATVTAALGRVSHAKLVESRRVYHEHLPPSNDEVIEVYRNFSKLYGEVFE